MVGKRVGQERKQKSKGGRSRGIRSRRRGREKLVQSTQPYRDEIEGRRPRPR
jgi:hypothetical protein